MTDNKAWLRRVTLKLNELHLNGVDFRDVHRWIFDWNENLTSKENLDNVSDEDRALTTLKQAGVIGGISKDNFYREQQEWQLADKGYGMWSDWDTTDPAHREYDYIWFVDWFDYDRFQKFCETHGFNPNETQTEPLDTNVIQNNETTRPDSEQIAKIHLAQKTLKLNLNGITYTLKHLNSKKGFNYNLAKKLLDNPDEWVSKDDMGSYYSYIRSKAKDWPKQMGFTGKLKDIFISVNTKDQKIMLNPYRSLTPNEAEIIRSLVKTEIHE